MGGRLIEDAALQGNAQHPLGIGELHIYICCVKGDY